MKRLGELASIKSLSPNKKSNPDSLFVRSVGEYTLLKEIDKSNFLIEVVPGKEVLKDYLFHILKKPLRQLLKEASGVAQAKLTIVTLKDIEIPVPTLERQQKLLTAKNVEHRFQKFWLESGVRTYEEPLKVNMTFDELLMLMLRPPNKE